MSEEDKTKQENDKLLPNEENGGSGPNYTWSQTLKEVTVTVPITPGTTAKQVLVQFAKDHLKIGLKGEEPLVDGKLHKSVIVDDSFWQLEDKKEIVVQLQKHNGMEWWGCVIEGHPVIDVAKIKPEDAKINDLDGEARTTVEKMMYDQRQQQLGLPTSKDQERMRMLKKMSEKNPNLLKDLERVGGMKLDPKTFMPN